jgi:DNA-binding transcriptional LysR family regulator
MNSTIDLVSTLVAVGETSSFSVAAKRLGVTTGTVSRAIARLEAQVGAQLVHRTTRRVSLSTAGQALFERAVSHVRALETALTSLPERQQEPAGLLRLSAPTDMGVTLLPIVLSRYLTLYPQVRVECDLSSRRVDLVAEGFDLALRASNAREPDSNLVMRRVISGEIRAYASPAYLARRGTPREIGEAGHDWIGFSDPKRRKLLDMKGEFRVMGNDMLFFREATVAGIGIGFMPNFIGDPLVATGSLVTVLPRARLPSGSISLVYPAATQVPRKVTAFRDVLIATLRRTAP